MLSHASGSPGGPSRRRRTPRLGRLTRVLFVCLGNICRSPTAEAVMRRLVAEAGREDEIEIESAGTGDWHVGHPPDARATAAGAGRGFALTGEAQQVTAASVRDFDVVVAMDRSNERDLRALGADDVVLLRAYDPEAAGDLDVPDPYYGGDDGFEEVLDIVERSARGLLETL